MHEPEPEAVFGTVHLSLSSSYITEIRLDERRWEKIETLGDGYSPRTGHTVVSYGKNKELTVDERAGLTRLSKPLLFTYSVELIADDVSKIFFNMILV